MRGCGADAAPYFRIFNPVTQGAATTRDGAYVRRWVPERAGADASRGPEPLPGALVEHGEARARALAAYQAVRVR